MILLAFVPFKVYNKSNFRGRLIHRNINKWDFLPPKIGVDLYTSSTYTPENTVYLVNLLKKIIQCSYKKITSYFLDSWC